MFQEKDENQGSTRSLHTSFKGIIDLSQWRRPGDDGAGSIRGKNTGCGPTTVRVWGVKKKPLLLDYIALSTFGSKLVTIWQMARGWIQQLDHSLCFDPSFSHCHHPHASCMGHNGKSSNSIYGESIYIEIAPVLFDCARQVLPLRK